MAFKEGVVLGTISFNATGSGATAIGATSNSGTINIGNTSSAAIAIDCGTAGITLGTTANAHATTVGSTNSTSATTVQSGSGALALTSTNGTLTINSGTGALSISSDASATTVNIATGGAVKTSTFGSTNSTSATTIQNGSGALNITSTNGTITMNSGTGTLAIANDATAQTVNIATGAGAKLVTLGTTNGASSLALKTGTADFSLASATGTIMSALDTGEITYPLQSAFLAVASGTLSNVTGDATAYQVVFGTEIYDQNSDYNNSTGLFTAPVTGRYLFATGLQMLGLLVTHTSGDITAIGSNRFMILSGANFFSNSTSTNLAVSGSFFLDMDANDTVYIRFTVSGGTKVVDLFGDGANGYTWFSGSLIC